MNRRSFLKAASLSAAAALTPKTAFAAQREALILHEILVDRSTRQGESFAQAAEARLLPLVEAPADPGASWRWRREAAERPVAGFLGREALFVLERLGWDRGMRLALKIEHRADGSGRLEHRLSGPAELVEELASSLRRAGEAFPAAMAEALTRLPARPGPQGALVVSTPAAAGLAQPLFSFVIAGRELGLPPYPNRAPNRSAA